jgi:peptidoglycan/xylan/chitin deacetylase (PgdA/CDA1 family)
VHVSVIIPARNAAETIAETLESLRSQTSRDWEAIVIDDGSIDATAAVSNVFAKQDARIRVVSRPHQGVCAARNAGIGLARFDWLLFLDADDWLSPSFLERMTRELAQNPSLDGVHCGWRRVAPDGMLYDGEFCGRDGDLFDLFACGCAFAIHACIVRKSLVEAVGGFDTSLRVCEDWDLWLRIARTGARFGAVGEALALYRMRPTSASIDGRQSLADGMRVIMQGHAPDPRVPNPHPAHANGRSASDISAIKILFACWSAGLMLGGGEDATPILEALRQERDPALDPEEVADNIFNSVLLSACRLPSAWIELWPTIEPRLDAFLTALESQTLTPRLVRRARAHLQRKILEFATAPRPLAFGTMYAIRVEITEPITDIHPPASAECLQCAIECKGEYFGKISLPVCDGCVPGAVLADAIAADFAWPILGRFFEHTIYRDLAVERSPEGVSIRRGTLLLGEGIPDGKDEHQLWSEAHDRIGWLVFLQEIWGRPDWPDARFYEPPAEKQEAPRRSAEDGWLVAEVSEDLPSVEISRPELTAVLTVGGVALGVVIVPVKENAVHTEELRAALNVASGFELCRAAVREGLLGQPFANGASLRGRLAAAASEHGANIAALASAEFIRTDNDFTTNPTLAPVMARALRRALSSGEPSLVLGRRAPETFGTSASRRAMLPAAAAHELLDAASIAGEPVIRMPRGNGRGSVVYAPDLLCRLSQSAPASTTTPLRSGAAQPEQAVDNMMNYFDGVFAAKSDPWQYASPYEQTKYEQTLELLPPGRLRRALELGCAEGHFTRQLAPRVGGLLAADISWIALDRATKRCDGLENVSFLQIDIISEPLPGRFDLIVCSEMLYYVESLPELQAIALKLADSLEPGGYLLSAHSNLVVDEPDRPGFDWDCPFGAKVIGETLAATPSLTLVRELRTPLNRIQLFRRERPGWFSFLRRPKVIELAEQPAPLPDEVARRVLWKGGSPRRENVAPAAGTHRLPILMYHRIAPTGSAATSTYRVTPEEFEEQLGYLRDAGYYSIGLEDWQAACAKKRPLPGRAVLITFDDGYRDFAACAWPLLKRYGFSATVFLVSDEIGRSNSWDRVFGEEVPLLGWPEILQLRSEGVEFGSHSATHSHLTGLSTADVVREGAHSRAILERELKTPIRAFAYPYGDVDSVVQHLIGACGYVFGLSCEPGLSAFQDHLLMLPRIEVTGSCSMGEFVSQLG